MPSDPWRPILIAEDDPVAVQLICACLDRLRLSNPRIVAEDGEAAIKALARCIDGDSAGLPALVLLDGQMPRRSGLDVVTWMQQHSSLGAVPVVMLTSDAEVDSIHDAYAGGATSYLVKPVGFEALGDVLRTLDVRWVLV